MNLILLFKQHLLFLTCSRKPTSYVIDRRSASLRPSALQLRTLLHELTPLLAFQLEADLPNSLCKLEHRLATPTTCQRIFPVKSNSCNRTSYTNNFHRGRQPTLSIEVSTLSTYSGKSRPTRRRCSSRSIPFSNSNNSSCSSKLAFRRRNLSH